MAQNSHKTKEFHKCLAGLPLSVQKKADEAFRLWSLNPWHPGLHFKRVANSEPIYSARIDANYRALCFKNQEPEAFIWFWIGSHSEYDRLLS